MRIFAYDLLSRNHLPQVWRQSALKAGRNASGTQRYRCQNPSCPTKTFMMTSLSSGHQRADGGDGNQWERAFVTQHGY